LGYFESTVLFWCPSGYDFDDLACSLESRTTVTRLVRESSLGVQGPLREAVNGEDAKQVAIIDLKDWYKLPPSEGLARLTEPEESFIKIFREGEHALELVTMAELFQAPVPARSIDLAIAQFAELVSIIGSIVDAESAWLTPLFSRSRDFLHFLEQLSETPSVVFPNSKQNIALFGFKSSTGFQVFVESRTERS
jgi:hypothetical protein